MIDKLKTFLERHNHFILTTHDPADADGLGAQLVFACILRELGKQFRIINSNPVPEQFSFMDRQGIIEALDAEKHNTLPEQSAVIMVDTADLHNIGLMRDLVCRAKEVFIIDHHEIMSASHFSGICDPSAASTCEMAVELAAAMNVIIEDGAAFAAYTGMVYDTGFFAYQKTSARSFRAAITLLELGVNPTGAYQELCQNTATRALLLQKRAFASLEIHCNGKAASQVLRMEDFAETGAVNDDSDGFVNVPLRAREIVVSVMVKESRKGKVKCSLRSKGDIDVSKIAHDFGGGGHVNASGFKSDLNVDQTLDLALAKITAYLGAK
ncbi:MAG: bifunctional oligoribonuclease/PAP phosphatase NrnA [Treponema sp.]|jgi:phosphoesterase RecJ-like protein|nr:bifunctional oligoribonuclease/PAP phosphatase NrnA [Treponema sp.]